MQLPSSSVLFYSADLYLSAADFATKNAKHLRGVRVVMRVCNKIFVLLFLGRDTSEFSAAGAVFYPCAALYYRALFPFSCLVAKRVKKRGGVMEKSRKMSE